MKTGPDIALLGSLIGDPARANMLTALMDGRALTASELAQEAGVTPQTASSHLAKLQAGGLLSPEKQGRHRYFRISGEEVAAALEALMGLAAHAGHRLEQTGRARAEMDRRHAERRERVLTLLGQHSAEFFRQMFIISHIDDVQQSPVFDAVWQIVRNEEGASEVQTGTGADGIAAD